MTEILYSEKFISQLEKLSPNIQNPVFKKIGVFKGDSKHPSLNTHKLNGKLKGYFAFSIDFQIRIIFEYGEDGDIHFLKIGSHDIYK